MITNKQRLQHNTPLTGTGGGLNDTTILLDEGVNTLCPNSAVLSKQPRGQSAQPAAVGFFQRLKQAVQFVLNGTLPSQTSTTGTTGTTGTFGQGMQSNQPRQMNTAYRTGETVGQKWSMAYNSQGPNTAYRMGETVGQNMSTAYHSQVPNSAFGLNGMNFYNRNQGGAIGTPNVM